MHEPDKLCTQNKCKVLTSSQDFSFWLANVEIDGNMVPLKAISMRYKSRKTSLNDKKKTLVLLKENHQSPLSFQKKLQSASLLLPSAEQLLPTHVRLEGAVFLINIVHFTDGPMRGWRKETRPGWGRYAPATPSKFSLGIKVLLSLRVRDTEVGRQQRRTDAECSVRCAAGSYLTFSGRMRPASPPNLSNNNWQLAGQSPPPNPHH